MAVWQFDVFFLQRESEIPSVEPGAFLRIPSLPHTRYDLGRFLTDEFGAPKPYSDHLLVWGDETGNRVDVRFLESRAVEKVGIRCDARAPSFSFCEKVCAHARAMGCVLFSPEQQLLIEPEPSDLWAALEASQAAAFVRDPKGYIEALAAKTRTLH
jgi:hypothetical protein